MLRKFALLGGILLLAAGLSASIFSSITGLIHDPQHRPVEGATVTLSAMNSAWSQTTSSNESGEFRFDNVPLGPYTIKVEAPGFASQSQSLTLASGTEARLHFPLTVASTNESVEVRDTLDGVNPESSTATTIVNREQIAATPGATNTNSMAMITDYVPGAYMVHDQLHIRGGHQVSWLLDGVPVPNTSIGTNVGPQFDPKDIDSIEVQRGGYSAEYGDRAYGVFNVVTRSGFERNREAEFVTSYGTFNQTDNQLSFGDHTERFAYYGSFTGYRTDLGLETPVPQVINDNAAGLSGFASLIFNKDAADQLRFVASARGDHFQVPIDPSSPLHDVEDERDDFANFSWLHTVSDGITLTISPFYHFNRAHYIGNPEDTVNSEYDRGSNYAGGVSTISVIRRRHNFQAGLQVFGERDNQFYAATDNTDPANDVTPEQTTPWANTEAVFLEDQFKATSWLTLNGGIRLTHYGGPLSENSADPRIGAAIQIPHLNWVLRGFYGRYYQMPPLVTVTSSSIQFFSPLLGERDEQREFGLTIPFQGWIVDISNFRTNARNFLDHDALNNSSIFFPLNLSHAPIHGWEATAKSPTVAGRGQFHLVYSHQYAQWSGIVDGGLISGDSCDTLCFLDHDQRNTIVAGFNVALPWKASADFNLNYGSGFLNGDGPAHFPSHTTFDLALGKSFGEKLSLLLTGLNLSNNHYMLDNSNTFGGTHFTNPREISAQLTYRFRY
ncbi:MAG TPA: TonB-dependent receptor [Candidatus Binataceae bacterium]|nr:TonB-dependent receptor [Candidatus Binataceae bacterium]